MSKFKSLHQKDETSKERRKRKSLLNNYTDELVIGKDESSSRHNQAHSQTANKKHHRELKQRRHVDESTWNEVFWAINKFKQIYFRHLKNYPQWCTHTVFYTLKIRFCQ